MLNRVADEGELVEAVEAPQQDHVREVHLHDGGLRALRDGFSDEDLIKEENELMHWMMKYLYGLRYVSKVSQILARSSANYLRIFIFLKIVDVEFR